MSLDSYKKVIEAQRKLERDLGYGQEHQKDSAKCEKKVISQSYDVPKRKKSSVTKITISFILIATFLLAAFKNPSVSEAKAEIKTMIMEKFNKEMMQQATNEENSGGKQFGFALAMLFAPAIIDKWVQTDVSDYIFFSTFDATVTVDEEKTTVASGVIVFGSVIILQTDLKKEVIQV